MKKIVLLLVFIATISTLKAQTDNAIKQDSTFNKWSVEFGVGFNNPQGPMTTGYITKLFNPYTLDLGVRYMFNNTYGMKVDFGYNKFKNANNTPAFDSKFYRYDIQGIANVGRIMRFQNWTHSFGLLAHSGFGLGIIPYNKAFNYDNVGNFILGVTPQFKLSDRVVLTGDFSTIVNFKQNVAFDASSDLGIERKSGVLFNATVGLTFYLGKHKEHADWIFENEKERKLDLLGKRVSDLESKMQDDDNDGVPNYLDIEPNTPEGNMVNTKGKSIDLNHNMVPDDIENYLLNNYANKSDIPPAMNNNDYIKILINDAYVAAYFDFNKYTPTDASTAGIDFILTYLRNNPKDSIDIIGHADELGKLDYNDKLAVKRANTIKNILIDANIDASRLNIVSAGEDTSVKKDSKEARKLVRRVTFKVK